MDGGTECLLSARLKIQDAGPNFEIQLEAQFGFFRWFRVQSCRIRTGPTMTLPVLQAKPIMLKRTSTSDTAVNSRFNEYPKYAPRIWHGMSFSNWIQLLREHHFEADRLPMSSWITFFSVVNSSCNHVQAAFYKRKAQQTPLVDDPIFILGHWRTGTTLLHSLFQVDERLWTPTTYECLSPDHFIVSERIFPHLMQMPTRRPMDNVSMGWNRPQEDELAICTRGATSVYRNIAFPHHPTTNLESLTMEQVSAAELQQWRRALQNFVSYLNYAHRRRLVLKSPTHTGRIARLLELYPNARFVHLTRDPHEFIPSTLHLWRALDATNGLRHDVSGVDRENYTFDCYRRMYGGFERQKSLIPSANFCQVTFENLTNDSVSVMRRIYESLSLGDFEPAEEPLQQFVDSQRNYKRNRHEHDSPLHDRIDTECADYLKRYIDPSTRQSRKAG